MAVDLHPDIVKAINRFANTPLGRKYGRWAKRRYGVGGKKLAAKTVAGEFGGRSTRSGRGVVSTAGARGPAQFIPSTRDAYVARYGRKDDPWASDLGAIKSMARHHMSTGVEGYNPGMPTYKDYILGQKINPEDIRALRTGGAGGGGFGGGGASLLTAGRRRPGVKFSTTVDPGISFAEERQSARRELLTGDISLSSLLRYAEQKSALKDVPGSVSQNIEFTPGKRAKIGDAVPGKGFKIYDGVRVPQGYKGKQGGIYEVFYDPAGKYWDAGGVHRGEIGGHDDHVHVSADQGYIVKLGHLAEQMGLHVGEHRRFGGTPSGGHTEGSFHYRDMGIDVSGPPAKMRKFARIMMAEAKRGHGR